LYKLHSHTHTDTQTPIQVAAWCTVVVSTMVLIIALHRAQLLLGWV